MPKTRDQVRAEYELEVLRATVFRNTSKAEAIQAAIKYAYDHVLAERLMNASATLR